MASDEVFLTTTTQNVDAYNIQVRPGDRVIFKFPNTPDYRPAVVFNSFPPNLAPRDSPRLGVFESLNQDGDEITGIVGPGPVGKHVYWIWLIPLEPGLCYRRLLCPMAISETRATVVEKMPPG